MIYDDDQQVEVRYIISLKSHDVDMFARDGTILEGEDWPNRNAIRLRKILGSPPPRWEPTPWFLSMANKVDKEELNIYGPTGHESTVVQYSQNCSGTPYLREEFLKFFDGMKRARRQTKDKIGTRQALHMHSAPAPDKLA